MGNLEDSESEKSELDVTNLSAEEERLKSALFARVMRQKSVTLAQLKDEVEELATLHIK